jgi:4-amino-4-deoxy-L-arabinose transferase-like glycosyltransferase
VTLDANLATDPYAPANPSVATDARTPGAWLTRDSAPRGAAPRGFWLAAVAIVLLTLFLRLWRLDLVVFRDDQATLLRLAEDIARLGSLPLAGMTSSIGIPLPPTFEYLMAPIVGLSRDPRLATAAIALANAAAVLGTLVLGWRWFSPLTGLVAGLAYATNPWAVFYARKVWSNDVLPPLAVLLMVCLDGAVVGGHAVWGLVAFPLFALGAELHPSFALLAPLVVVLAVVMLRRGQLRYVAVGVGLALLTAAPYLVYTVQTQADYLRALPSSGPGPRIDPEAAADIIGMIGGWRNGTIEGLDSNFLLPLRLAAVPGAIQTVLLALGAAAALLLVFRSQRREQRLRAGGLLVWVLLPMVLMFWHTIPLYDYYFLFVLPPAALLVGMGIQMLADLVGSRRPGRVLVGAALAGVLVMALLQSAIVLRQLTYVSDHYVMIYGPPLAAAEQTTRELLDQLNASGGRELAVEIDDVNDVAIGYLARPYVPEVEVVSRRRGPWNTNFDLPNASGSAPYALAAEPQLTPSRVLDVAYADRVRVLSASTTRSVSPGESPGLALLWTLDHHVSNPLTPRLVWEMSLYDPSGQEVRRIAGLPHDWGDLADGDVVMSWITVATAREAPAGVYQVHVNRLDPQTRKPLASVGAGDEWSAGTLEVRAN